MSDDSKQAARVLASTEHPADDVMVRATAAIAPSVRWRLNGSMIFDGSVDRRRDIFVGSVLSRPADDGDALAELVDSANLAVELARALDNRHGAAEGPSNQEYDNEVALLDRAREKGLIK